MRHFGRSCRRALSLDRTSEFDAVRWPLNSDCGTLLARWSTSMSAFSPSAATSDAIESRHEVERRAERLSLERKG
jgi:hypothetical protein